MRIAKVSVAMADVSSKMIGELSLDDALFRFDSFPWVEEVERAKRLERDRKSSVSPDMTFTTLPYHLTATVHESPEVIDIELCTPKENSFLGVIRFRTTQFFHFEKVSRREFGELLRAFLTLPLENLYANFTKIKNA